MPTFERADKSVEQLAKELIAKYETHQPLSVAEPKIDFVFAFGDVNDEGVQLNDALKKNGVKALGICKIVSLKERALDRGDAEISLDGDWWKQATEDQQAALLDHELHHITIKCDKAGNIQHDDLGRPQIKLRKHDVEVGWFRCIAERHGAASMEQMQAKAIMDFQGQFYWPGIAPTVTITAGDKSVTVAAGAFSKRSATKI